MVDFEGLLGRRTGTFTGIHKLSNVDGQLKKVIRLFRLTARSREKAVGRRLFGHHQLGILMWTSDRKYIQLTTQTTEYCSSPQSPPFLPSSLRFRPYSLETLCRSHARPPPPFKSLYPPARSLSAGDTFMHYNQSNYRNIKIASPGRHSRGSFCSFKLPSLFFPFSPPHHLF